MKVFLAAGHGGNDPGSIGADGSKEADEVIKVVHSAIAFLQKQDLKGNEIVLVPDEFALEAGVKYINDHANPSEDICIEVHLNNNKGNPGTGVETYFGNKPLGEIMHEEIVRVMQLPDRGLKDGMWLYFNNTAKPASTLVELGFINNPQDLLGIRQKGALAVASGIYKFLTGETLGVPAVPTEEEPVRNNSVLITAEDPLRVRTAPRIIEGNQVGSFSNGALVAVDMLVAGDAPAGSTINMWWKLRDVDHYIWSGGTNQPGQPQAPEIPVASTETAEEAPTPDPSTEKKYTQADFDNAVANARKDGVEETEKKFEDVATLYKGFTDANFYNIDEVTEELNERDKQILDLRTQLEKTGGSDEGEGSETPVNDPEDPLPSQPVNPIPVQSDSSGFGWGWLLGVLNLFKDFQKFRSDKKGGA